MTKSSRARRMERHHKKGAPGRLNLVSLMDIFTILVFFLLVNSSEVEVLPSGKVIQMPESVAEQKPRETVIIMITAEDILVQGEAVSGTRDALRTRQSVIGPLKRALEAQAARLIAADVEDRSQREVTIMGDKAIPFQLLKKVMATCTEADYGRISLAVMHKSAASQARS